MKKLLSLILALCLILPAVPAAALPDQTEISEICLEVEAPIAGTEFSFWHDKETGKDIQTPAPAVTIPDGALYTVGYAKWVTLEGHPVPWTISDPFTFEEEETYYIDILLLPVGDLVFAEVSDMSFGDAGFGDAEFIRYECYGDSANVVLSVDAVPGEEPPVQPSGTMFSVWKSGIGGYTVSYTVEDENFYEQIGEEPLEGTDGSVVFDHAVQPVVPAGTEVTLTAVPSLNREFKGWYPSDQNYEESGRLYTDELLSSETTYTFVPVDPENGMTAVCAVFSDTCLTDVSVAQEVVEGDTSVTFHVAYQDVLAGDYMKVMVRIHKANETTVQKNGYWDMEQRNRLGTGEVDARFINMMEGYVFEAGDSVEWKLWLDTWDGENVDLGERLEGTFAVPEPWTVTFDSNGGTPVAAQRVGNGRTIQSDTPTRENYTFADWYRKGTTEVFPASTPVTEDLELIAGWFAGSMQYEDLSEDVSTTTVTGILRITDRYSGSVHEETIDGGTVASTYSDAQSGEGAALLEEVEYNLGVAARQQAGTKTITITKDNEIEVGISETYDRRTFNYINEVDENYFVTRKFVVGGSYAKIWNLTVTLEAEYGDYTWLSMGTTAGGGYRIDDGELHDYSMNMTVEYDSDYTLVAVPDEGYQFVGWYEGVIGESYFVENHTDVCISTDPEYSYRATSGKAIRAVFKKSDVACTKLALKPASADVATRSSLQLKATFTPSNTTNKTLTWTSSDPTIASVDKNGKVTAKKYGKVTITAKTVNGKKATCKIQTRFYDVNNSGKTYYVPVYWAADNRITRNTVNFNPEDTVTRGEFVAFLHRMAGEPGSSAKLSFTDVNSSHKFYKAIRWAVGKGIIKGYKDKTFRPEVGVTRGEAATMLWRWAGKPAPKTSKSPFSDVKPSKADAYKAILWGNENGIIKGKGGQFLKNDGCTRANIVTFLYRYNENVLKK